MAVRPWTSTRTRLITVDMNIKDLSGKRFGRLTALERLPRKYKRCFLWRCRCDCGRECEIPTDWLTQGVARSCGCLKRHDITGQRRDHLTAIRPTGEMSDRGAVWVWRCDCGRETERGIDSVGSERGGSTMCRACARELKRRQAAAMADGIVRTESGASVEAVEAIRAGKLPRNNSSGIRGVHWHSRIRKWNARVSVNGRLLSLGYYDTIEEAAKARAEAVKRIYGDGNDQGE